jgi:hypothetical protein
MANRVYLLRVIDLDALDSEAGSKFMFSPWVDDHGFVVVAENEDAARALVVASAGEGIRSDPPSYWLDPKWTSCEEVTLDKPRIVMADTPTG